MSNERLIYLPLGGAGEIGMNAYVYGWGAPDKERLIVVDLGVTFPEMEGSPGVDLIFADVHEDGRHLYPGTGAESETGTGRARGTKLNIAMEAGAGDDDFKKAWSRVESYIDHARPEFILFQCGADSLEGDPITNLRYTEQAHADAAAALCALADKHCGGRIVGTGGGGYNRRNLARAWTRVVQSFVEAG